MNENMVTHLPRVQAMSGFCGCLPGGQGLPSAWFGMNVFFLFWFLDVEFLVETSEENSEFHEKK